MNAPMQALAPWCDAERPWRSGFFSVMRALDARHKHARRAGTAALPSEETFRLRQTPSMQFAPREVASLAWQDEQLQVSLYGLGIWGPNGALPLHMTEQVITHEGGEPSPQASVADLFHHRMLSLFYRAWASSQSAASLDHDDARFSFYVASLAGMSPAACKQAPFPLSPRLGSSAHLVREVRNPDGLCQSVSACLGIPAQIQEYVMQWIALQAQDRTALGCAAHATILGDGAVLGEYVPDCQHRFRLVLGPLTLAQYLRLVPGGEDFLVLVDMLRTFIGIEYAWETMLLLHPDETVAATLPCAHRLGVSAWLGQSASHLPTTGMVCEPEWYCRQQGSETVQTEKEN